MMIWIRLWINLAKTTPNHGNGKWSKHCFITEKYNGILRSYQVFRKLSQVQEKKKIIKFTNFNRFNFHEKNMKFQGRIWIRNKIMWI